MGASPSELAGGGPDFFCIGAQKAGTGWLYEQLRSHRDFWMPPMKELHYFDRHPRSDPAIEQRTLPVARKEVERIAIARERARDERDNEFLDRFQCLAHHPIVDLRGYADLFRFKGELLSGDITPGYSLLNDRVVEMITGGFPHAKVIFIARDPVERAWSQLSMYVRRGLIEQFDADNPERIVEQLRRPEFAARSYPSEIVRRWRRWVSPDRFGLYFFDNLARDPAGVRKSMITFLGGDPMKPSGSLPPNHNAKATKQKLTMTPTARAGIAQFFENELRACAVELGGPAIEWPRRYRS